MCVAPSSVGPLPVWNSPAVIKLEASVGDNRASGPHARVADFELRLMEVDTSRFLVHLNEPEYLSLPSALERQESRLGEENPVAGIGVE